MRNPLKHREKNMGRRPIHDEAMSPAERQRRRRARVRDEPWRDQRLTGRAILQALRDLQGDGAEASRLAPETLAQIIDQAVENLAPEDDAVIAEVRATVAKLLDPSEPLPERGRRGRHGHRGHRRGDGARRRHGRRGKDNDAEKGAE
jgi:hypothetical protein